MRYLQRLSVSSDNNLMSDGYQEKISGKKGRGKKWPKKQWSKER